MIASSPFRSALSRGCRLLGFAAFVGVAAGARAAAPFGAENIADFTDRYCSNCHNDVDKEGGLDLTTLKYDPADPANFLSWVKVHDRMQAGEMPPKEKKRPPAADLSAFLNGLSSSLIATEQKKMAVDGR